MAAAVAMKMVVNWSVFASQRAVTTLQALLKSRLIHTGL
jgi:hypothetical protein